MDSLEGIEAGARDVLRGYPLAAGLTSVADVIHELPAPRPFSPTLWSSPQSVSLHAGPPEPLFDQYSREIATLLSKAPLSPEEESWRNEQLERGLTAVESEARAFDVGFGGVTFVAPPFLQPSTHSNLLPPTSSTSDQFLRGTNFAHPPAASAPSSHPPPQEDPSAFFAQFLIEQKAKRVTRSSAKAASTSASTSITNGSKTNKAYAINKPIKKQAAAALIPPSSPDPLMMTSSNGSQPQASQSSNPNAMRDQRATTPDHPSTSSLSSPQSSHSAFSVEIPVLNRAQGSHKAEVKKAKGEGKTPDNIKNVSGLGVESAVQRIRLVSGSAMKVDGSSAGTTGQKHGSSRELIERFGELVNDIESADDALVNDTSSANLATSTSSSNASPIFNIESTTSNGQALLSSSTLRKLIKSLTSIKSREKGEEMLVEVGEGGVARLLRILERSWDKAEDLSFWSKESLSTKKERIGISNEKGKGRKKAVAKGKASPRKGKGRKNEEEDDEAVDDLEETYSRTTRGSSAARASRSRSNTPITAAEAENDREMELDDRDVVWTQDALDHFDESVESLEDAVLAIRAALALLTITPLPKNLYSADYIISIFTVLRHAMDAFLCPLLEASSNSHLADLAADKSEAIQAICDSTEAVIPLVARLVHDEEMSEEIVISSIYYSLSPFFHEGASPLEKGKKVEGEGQTVAKAIRGIRMKSLALIRVILGRYPDQRAWIIEEVLGNLTQLEVAKKGKGAFRLRNGASIHTISALIMHLVQTTPSELCRAMSSRILSKQGTDVEMKDSQGEDLTTEEDEIERSGSTPLESAYRGLVEPAIDAANKSARTVINHLLTKSCKVGKASTGSTESEYKAIFDNLIADLLTTLHLPEWPASELLLTVYCRSMISTLSDPKNTHESNAYKGVALDHIGTIAARLRQDFASVVPGTRLKAWQELVISGDSEELGEFVGAEQEVRAHLQRLEKINGSEGASAFSAALHGQYLMQVHHAATSKLSNFSESEQLNSEQGRHFKNFHDQITTLATEFWTTEPRDDVFGPNIEDAQPRIDALVLRQAGARPLCGLYDSMVERIVQASDSTAVTARTKALRALSLIVAQDPDLFYRADIKASIEGRMLDSSPAVRDTTLELVGKYVIGRPDLAVEYLPQICERIVDTGLGVRRRVVKLLKVLYTTLPDEQHQIAISTKLVWRITDEDDGIKELAVDALEDLWFSQPLLPAREQASEGKSGIAHLASVIMSVSGSDQARPPPVDEVLRAIIAKHLEKGTKAPLDRLRQVTESLIDGLVEDDESRNVVTCIKTVHTLNSADPSLLSTAKATLLLPFLKSATSPDEMLISDYLLKIFRSTVIALPKTASKFARDLQTALTAMLNKPSLAGGGLSAVVACFCAVIRGQTQDFSHFIEVFSRSINRLEKELKTLRNPETAAKGNPRAVPLLACLSALLCEHGRFDDIRRAFPDTEEAIDAITSGPISSHVFNILISLYNLKLGTGIQSILLTSLGYIYHAYPQLMVTPKSTAVMDGIFGSDSPPAQIHLLRVIQEFLSSQEQPDAPVEKVKVEKGIKIAELVGNVDGFADSGVSSAICQRYDSQIISSALSTNPPLQRVAVDILSSMARSGFIHPLSVLPTLIALTACPDPHFASKAYATLSLIYQKYASLCATRFAEPARQSHMYMLAVAGSHAIAQGYRGDPPVSHFNRWYTLVRDKRQTRLDYLKVLSRMFEVEPGAECSENDVSLARYVAEALSSIEYKTQEEPMCIISHLNACLAVAGLQVLHLLEAGMQGGGGLLSDVTPTGSPSKISQGATSAEAERTDSLPPTASLARQSLVCGLALLLRDHLKTLYGITEVKLSKFTLGKKSALGDRPAVRKSDAALALGLDSYQRLPYAVKPLATASDLEQQRMTYCALIGEDGTILAVEVEEEEEN